MIRSGPGRQTDGFLLPLMTTGCRQDMHDQPRYEPLEKSDFFADQRSSRPLIEDTVARGHLDDNPAFYEGKNSDGKAVTTFPQEFLSDNHAASTENLTGAEDKLLFRSSIKKW